MRILKRAAAMVALAVATPALAADPATLGCIEQSVTPAVRAMIEADSEAAVDQNAPYRAETRSAIASLVAQCAARHGWSDKAQRAALLYAAPAIGWPGILRGARRHGVDGLLLERRYMALPPADLASAITEAGKLNEDLLVNIGMAALQAGEIKSDNARIGGRVIGNLAMREKGRVDFAAF